MARRMDVEAAKKSARKEENKKKLEKERKLKQIKLTAIVVGAIAVAAAIIVGIVAMTKKSEADDPADLHETIIAENSYAKVDAAMVAYYIGEAYIDLLNSSSDMELDIMGIDKNKKLNEMVYEGKKTWFDVLAEDACNDVGEWLAYCLAAEKAEVTLTDDELRAISERASKLDLSRFPKGITVDDAVKALKIQALGEKYKAIITASNTAGADEIEEYINKNKKNYFKTSYRYYYIAYGTIDDVSDASAADVSEEVSEEIVLLTKEEALAEGNKIAAAKSENEFIDYTRDFIVSYFETATEASAKETAETYVVKDAVISDDKLAKWIYNSNRKLYDTTVFDSGNGTVAVVMITALPEFVPGNPTADISSMALYSEEEAKNAADYAAECGSFEKACMVYSRDFDGCFSGGRMQNYAIEDGSDELNDWVFGEAKSGDIKIIKGGRYWHVVRYNGEGAGKAKASVAKLLSAEAIKKAQTEIISGGRVTKSYSQVSVIDY